MNFKVTIIIPFYNSEKFIRRTLKSIEIQTIGLENIEVLMFNDCSTDRTKEIIDEYADKYSNFKAIHFPENTGSSGIARNKGIKLAKADYLMFLDHDDTFKKDACEVLYKTITSENVDHVIGSFTVNNQKHLHGTPQFFRTKGNVKISNVKECPQLFHMAPGIWSCIFNKKLIIDNKIEFPTIIGEDAIFLAKVLLNANGIVFLTDFIACNHEDLLKESLSNRRDRNNFKEYLDSITIVGKLFDEFGMAENFEDYVEYRLNYFLNHIILSDFDKNDIKFILKEMKWITNSFWIRNHEFKELKKNQRAYILFSAIINENIEFIMYLKQFLYKQFMQERKLNKLKNNNKQIKNKLKNLKSTKKWLKYKLE
ncbi:Glycosyltransferase AglE [Candidatus Methanobinarius endosymbioticus]|uniref:Glycosyltransferase AglE n=1 Tax=Candidatus Methanobinarius endosymbioticus TaxID=2006182 RepID=A0A366MB77_9EURY|nr:Glycosyltransferase AglE [Candidatus Methanobinarius endosymbioticus]